MERPTTNDILELAGSRSYRKPKQVIECVGVSLIYRYAIDARAACKAINDKYGSWVYAAVYAHSRSEVSVSVSYRSAELPKCEYCGWVGGGHSSYCHRPKEQ